MNKNPESIGIIGLSHLGIVWSSVLASYGYNIIGYDIDETIVSSLNDGIVPITEPGVQNLYNSHKDRFRFSTDPKCIRNCSIVFFLKDVPYDDHGVIELEIIYDLFEKVISQFSQNSEIVFQSQVPVGFTRKLQGRIRDSRPNLSFNLIYCAATLTIGTALEWFRDPDRIIFGFSDKPKKASSKLLSIFRHFTCPVECISYESAELTKEAIQLKLATSVTFVNTVSDLCEKLGADINEVMNVIKLDKRFSPYDYWRPGLGFAGGHIERGLATLNKLSVQNDISPMFIDTIIKLSDERYLWLKKIIDDHIISRNSRPRICLWGLSYKKGTDSLHNAHCLKIIRDYAHRSHITAYDPLTILPEELNFKQFSSKFDALKNSDCLIILTEWDECIINDPSELKVMNNPVVIDCVDIVGSGVREDQSISYFGMGFNYKIRKHGRKA